MKIDSLVLALYCGVIFLLSHQPTLPIPLTFPHQDKFVHATAYGVMAFLSWRAFSNLIQTRLLLVGVTVMFCSAYGVSDEFHQSFIEGREADVWDWVADTTGALMMSFVLLWRRYRL